MSDIIPGGSYHELPDFEGDTDLGGFAIDQSPLPDPDPVPDEGQIDEFDPRVAEDVEGLLFLGALSSEFELFGHQFVMRTLRVGEELAVAQVVKQYEGTLAQGKAYAIANVAASIVTVDGRPLVESLGPDQEETLTTINRKFAYVRSKWYFPVVELLYQEFSQLRLRQAAALEEFAGKLQAGRPTPLPFAGSLSDRGF